MKISVKLKRFICILLVFAFCFGAFSQGGKNVITTEAKTIDQYQEQIQKLKDQKKATDAKIKETKGNVAKEKENQAAIDSQISTTQALMSALDAKINQLSKDISDTEVKLSDQEKAINKGISDFKLRLRAMYLSGNDSVASIMLGSTDFYDMLMKMEMCKRVAKYDNDTINNLIAMKNQFEATKKDLETKKAEQQASRDDFASNLGDLNSLKSQSKAALQELQKDQAAYQAESDDIKKQQDEAEKQVERLMAEMNSKNKNYVGGNFAWPVPGFYNITSGFGWRTDPFTKRSAYHPGYDIASGPNSIYRAQIVAANDGTVVLANNGNVSYGYGRYIIIDHGGGYKTLYGHTDQLLVQEGQTVKKGQVIAYVGTTGRSTGYHLHFGIMKNGNWVDPANPF